ncbi:type II toxin-antitoxin system VapC family toxin [Dankookia sp. P2]|uniref:type II toxin-antitoxin system VapC family toxin n=1 Tax=Dankookia sp. P2 TaxID=3423955 RepID=UPI003D66C2CD
MGAARGPSTAPRWRPGTAPRRGSSAAPRRGPGAAPLIAVDSSVLIDALRGRPTPATLAFRRLIAVEEVVIGDLVLLEVLRGVPSEGQARRLERQLAVFRQVPMLSPELATQAAAHYRRLRERGVTPRSTPDLIIASWCIAHAVPLLQRGRDFAPMADHLGLQLVAA